jgi:death-on-curing protein
MTRLTPQQIEAMHSLVIRETGGLDGIRDQRLLDSALQSPFQTFGGKDLYPSLPEKAARLG